MTTSRTLLTCLAVVLLLTLRSAACSPSGKLYPGALSDPDGPAPTYLDMMRHNARTLLHALAR